MRFGIITILFTLASVQTPQAAESSAVVPSGHSHNDYQHDRPLWKAIDNHFISIEVDIHLVGEALLVGHDEEDLDETLTLQSLYLMPLRSYVKDHNGWVYSDKELLLLIDIKSSPDSTYRALRRQLVKYSDILTTYTGAHIEKRAVSVIISGNRPRQLMLEQATRYATYDGRLQDLNSKNPANFITLLSDDWEDHFVWRGKGAMPREDREKLTRITTDAHAAGYKVRFWNLPTSDRSRRKAVWDELLRLGVDLISVDDLEAYRDFLTNKPVDLKNQVSQDRLNHMDGRSRGGRRCGWVGSRERDGL